MKRLLPWALAALVLGLVALGLLARRAAPPTPGPGGAGTVYRSFQAEVMATTIRVELPDRPEAEADAEAVFQVFRDVDARASEWKETSPLAAVNRAAGLHPVPVPDDLRALLHRGIEIGRLTGGAFDITWAALWGLWDFRSPHPRVPERREIARRAALVDFRKVEIDDRAGTVFLPEKGMKIGLGGIAKGWALDRAEEVLAARAVESYLLLGGGQVAVGGTREGRPWRIGIRDPRGPADDFFATLELAATSASTSGDYESYFVVDGVRYHHILDPRTGMPARGLESATVVSPDATLADALSTAIMVLGRERGLALLARLPGVEAVVVDTRGRVAVTPGLGDRYVEIHPPG